MTGTQSWWILLYVPLCATNLLLSDHVCFTEGKMGCVPIKSSPALWWAPFLWGRGPWGASNLTIDFSVLSQAFCGEPAGHVQAPLWYQRGVACFLIGLPPSFLSPSVLFYLLASGHFYSHPNLLPLSRAPQSNSCYIGLFSTSGSWSKVHFRITYES